MKISSISDLHIRTPDDNASKVLLGFFSHPLVQASDKIFLLGDIFDLMCGDHPEYLSRFKEIFNEIRIACVRGAEVYYFEGNHDLHLDKVFKRLFKEEKEEIQKKMHLITGSISLSFNDESFFFSHGDEYDYNNESYQKYKKMVTGKWVKLFADHVMPLKVLDYVGIKAADQSRKRGQSNFNEDSVRAKIRKGVELLNSGESVIVGGHSHIRDEFKFNSKQIYYNNGFPVRDNVFLYYNSEKWSFEPILSYKG